MVPSGIKEARIITLPPPCLAVANCKQIKSSWINWNKSKPSHFPSTVIHSFLDSVLGGRVLYSHNLSTLHNLDIYGLYFVFSQWIMFLWCRILEEWKYLFLDCKPFFVNFNSLTPAFDVMEKKYIFAYLFTLTLMSYFYLLINKLAFILLVFMCNICLLLNYSMNITVYVVFFHFYV